MARTRIDIEQQKRNEVMRPSGHEVMRSGCNEVMQQEQKKKRKRRSSRSERDKSASNENKSHSKRDKSISNEDKSHSKRDKSEKRVRRSHKQRRIERAEREAAKAAAAELKQKQLEEQKAKEEEEFQKRYQDWVFYRYTLGMDELEEPKRSDSKKKKKYTKKRSMKEAPDQCHQCYRRRGAQVICSKGILCAFCVKDFYPDKAYEKGICRCSICHPKFLQYEWFHEVISAHYETYPSKNENHFGEWLYKLIKVVLERLCEADDGELVEPPNDPFEVLREELSRVYPKKKLPAKKSNKLRKLQETSSCHLCHKKEVECASEMLWCEAPNCGLVFCRTRLEKYHYDHYAGFDDTKELFICPRCEGICLCSKCNMKKADETMMTSNKTRRQWMIYYLYNIHIFAGDRMLYEVLRSIMPSTNLIAKIASHLLLMYAPPAH